MIQQVKFGLMIMFDIMNITNGLDLILHASK